MSEKEPQAATQHEVGIYSKDHLPVFDDIHTIQEELICLRQQAMDVKKDSEIEAAQAEVDSIDFNTPQDEIAARRARLAAANRKVYEMTNAAAELSGKDPKSFDEAINTSGVDMNRLNSLEELWKDNGGEDIEAAQTGVDAINFNTPQDEIATRRAKLANANRNFLDSLTDEVVNEAEADKKEAFSHSDIKDMKDIAEVINKLRASGKLGELGDKVTKRFEDELQSMLVAYEKSDNFDAKLADDIMDATDYKSQSSKIAETNANHSDGAVDPKETFEQFLNRREDDIQRRINELREKTDNNSDYDTEEHDAIQGRIDELRELKRRYTYDIVPQSEPVIPEYGDAQTAQLNGAEKGTVRFAGLKDRLRGSKLGKWSKDKLSGSENKNRRTILVTTGIGLAALIGVGLATSGTDKVGSPVERAIDEEDDTPPPAAMEFTEDAHYASKGKGWLEQLDDMGVPKAEQPEMLDKITNSKEPGITEWRYLMKDGRPGIAKTGEIPQDVLKSVMKLGNK